jgi:hypothetical protein
MPTFEPVPLAEKAILLPSGDQAGRVPFANVTTPPWPSTSITTTLLAEEFGFHRPTAIR